VSRLGNFALNGATAVVTVAALALAGVRIKEFARPTTATDSQLRSVEKWQHYGQAGHRVGATQPRVLIVEFTDFKCRFCRAAAAALDSLVARYPSDVAVVYRHFPGSNPAARPAAIAAECAAKEHRYKPFHDALFAQAESIGVKSWSGFAEAAGVRDTIALATCIKGDMTAGRLAADRQAGADLEVLGTPTFLINDVVVEGFPGLRVLVEHVREQIAIANKQ